MNRLDKTREKFNKSSKCKHMKLIFRQCKTDRSAHSESWVRETLFLLSLILSNGAVHTYKHKIHIISFIHLLFGVGTWHDVMIMAILLVRLLSHTDRRMIVNQPIISHQRTMAQRTILARSQFRFNRKMTTCSAEIGSSILNSSTGHSTCMISCTCL